VDVLEISHPFVGHALNAVDAKGRVSVPAPIRNLIDLRVKTHGVAGDETKDKELLIAPSPKGDCLRAYDVIGHRLITAELRESVADLPAAERRDALAALRRQELGTLVTVSFDGAGRMVLPPILRELGGIEDLAFFIGVEDYFEIWNPALARDAFADQPIALRTLEKCLSHRGEA
jgi:MraZ protein